MLTGKHKSRAQGRMFPRARDQQTTSDELFSLVGWKSVVCGKGQECHVASALDGLRQHALVFGTVPGLAPRTDLAAIGHCSLEQTDIFVIDLGTFETDTAGATGGRGPPAAATTAAASASSSALRRTR
jgi:hypothetical protein